MQGVADGQLLPVRCCRDLGRKARMRVADRQLAELRQQLDEASAREAEEAQLVLRQLLEVRGPCMPHGWGWLCGCWGGGGWHASWLGTALCL
jgi:hypothetical protein